MADTSLHQLCFTRELPAVQALASSLPESALVTKDGDHRTPLHWAAAGAKEETVSWLLSHAAVAAKINARDEAGFTALHSAVASGNAAVVKSLLAAGADASIRNEDGAVPLHYHKGRQHVIAALLPAYRDGRAAAGGGVNTQDDHGVTPLHRAAGPGHMEATRLLLGAGANPNLADARGDSALHYACEEQRAAVAELLMEHGGSLRQKNKEGKIPLELCADARVMAAIAAAGKSQATEG